MFKWRYTTIGGGVFLLSAVVASLTESLGVSIAAVILFVMTGLHAMLNFKQEKKVGW